MYSRQYRVGEEEVDEWVMLNLVFKNDVLLSNEFDRCLCIVRNNKNA